jgi:hypothetical protein
MIRITPSQLAMQTQSSPRWKNWCALLAAALVLAAGPAVRGDDPDERYLTIYNVIQQGDSLSASGKTERAIAKYRQAEADLVNFQRDHRDWNAKTVTYRINYCAERIAALSAITNAPASGAGTSDSKPAVASGGPSAKLLEAGAEPRKALRLHPKLGDKQTLTLNIKTDMEMKMGDTPGPAMKLPAIILSLDTTIKDVSAEGDITYEIVLADVKLGDEEGAAPEVVAAMKSAFEGAKGLAGTGTVTDRGVNKGTKFEVPAGADAQVRQAVEQMKESFSQLTTPLPEEAVGVGAKWEAKRDMKSQGMTMQQTETYQLAAMDGDRLTLKNTIGQTAPKQKVENPAMPGVKLDLEKMSGTGSGDAVWDLGRLLPSSGGAELKSEQAMSINAGGQKQPMTMKLDVKVQMEGK